MTEDVFQFIMSSLISSINVLEFSVYESFKSLVKFITKYFILFGVIVNGIFSQFPVQIVHC